MWKENTEIESEGFPVKREVTEKCKMLIRLTLTFLVIAWSKPRQGVHIKKVFAVLIARAMCPRHLGMAIIGCSSSLSK